MSAQQLIKQVANTDHDFEWYPTTSEIIGAIKSDIENDDYFRFNENPSVLDCGAGDGRVLKSLTNGKKYAIEKSEPLLNSLDRNIFVVGTEFNQQTLIDKKVDIVFSNPPYSDYSAWTVKIIREANAGIVYLVIPERWAHNTLIEEALKSRDAKAVVIGDFDFLNADRAARAKVQVLRIELSYGRRHSGNRAKTDPFKLWFDSNFSINASISSNSSHQQEASKKAAQKRKIRQDLVSGSDIIQVLDRLYQLGMTDLINTYKKLESLDVELLKEMDVNLEAVCDALSMKIAGLKDRYWKELFENLGSVTDKLTSQSRTRLFDILTENTHIDFTPSNARSIIIWVLKNANEYYDDQLIDTVETMVDAANVVLYKSNKKTFGDEDWRYCRRPDDLDCYSLEYRAVFHSVGGLAVSSWNHENPACGLNKRAITFLDDLRTVASNLGYDTSDHDNIESMSWGSGVKNEIHCTNLRTSKNEVLFECRAYKNGNIHIKFNQSFLKRMNVEFGRLKGWLKDASQAADEIDITIEDAESSFLSNKKIKQADMLMLSNG